MFRKSISTLIIPVLFLIAIVCFLFLLSSPSFERKKLWNFKGLKNYSKNILIRFAIAGSAFSIVCYYTLEEQFLIFPSENFYLWLAVLLFYPLLSVYTQEVIFRAFFFHRYSLVFPHKYPMIILSGLAFGFAHIFYGNWVAVLLSTLGGFLFSNNYHKSGSIASVCLEHGLWGDLLFTLGLGIYFFSGAIN